MSNVGQQAAGAMTPADLRVDAEQTYGSVDAGRFVVDPGMFVIYRAIHIYEICVIGCRAKIVPPLVIRAIDQHLRWM